MTCVCVCVCVWNLTGISSARATRSAASVSINYVGLFSRRIKGHLGDFLRQASRWLGAGGIFTREAGVTAVWWWPVYSMSDRNTYHKAAMQKQDVQLVTSVTTSSWILQPACLSQHISAPMPCRGHHAYYSSQTEHNRLSLLSLNSQEFYYLFIFFVFRSLLESLASTQCDSSSENQMCPHSPSRLYVLDVVSRNLTFHKTDY